MIASIAHRRALPLAIWLYLLLGRGCFWLARERDDRDRPPEPAAWPAVVAVVPARNEADVIARSIGSLLAQDYPGAFRVVLVDDQSDDGTGAAPRARPARDGRLTVLAGAPLPAGWTGKLWAVSQGVERSAGRRARLSAGSPMPTSPMRRTICAAWWRAPRRAAWCWSR